MEPRDLIWVFPQKLGLCECPGGYGPDRRDVRLREEIIWIRKNNFDAVIPLVSDPFTREAYASMRIPNYEIPLKELPSPVGLHEIYTELARRLDEGQKLLMHRHHHDEILMGFIGCFLLWRGNVDTAVKAEQVVMMLFNLQLGMSGRQALVDMVNWCEAAGGEGVSGGAASGGAASSKGASGGTASGGTTSGQGASGGATSGGGVASGSAGNS